MTEGLREAEDALFNAREVLEVDAHLVAEIKRRAHASAKGCYRLCLHGSTRDPVQEMIIAGRPGSYCRPHRHPGRPTSYCVLEGELLLLTFDDAGRVTRRVRLGAPGRGLPFCLRLAADVWHTTVFRDEVLFYESMAGPYERERANVYAGWSPREDDAAGVARFLAEVRAP